jgi:hypothetical protein
LRQKTAFFILQDLDRLMPEVYLRLRILQPEGFFSASNSVINYLTKKLLQPFNAEVRARNRRKPKRN